MEFANSFFTWQLVKMHCTHTHAHTHMLIIFVDKLYQNRSKFNFTCADSQTIFQFFHPLISGLQCSHFFLFFIYSQTQWNSFSQWWTFFLSFFFSSRAHYKTPIKHTRNKKLVIRKAGFNFFIFASSSYNLLNSVSLTHSHTYKWRKSRKKKRSLCLVFHTRYFGASVFSI